MNYSLRRESFLSVIVESMVSRRNTMWLNLTISLGLLIELKYKGNWVFHLKKVKKLYQAVWQMALVSRACVWDKRANNKHVWVPVPAHSWHRGHEALQVHDQVKSEKKKPFYYWTLVFLSYSNHKTFSKDVTNNFSPSPSKWMCVFHSFFP